VYARGEPYRNIAALELLGVLFSWLAFGDAVKAQSPAVIFSGGGDNKGNAHVVESLLTTKFPLCAVLMELSAQLARAGRRMVLRWYPRLQNTEADDLSNGLVHGFDPGRRVYPDFRPESLLVLPDLVKYGEELYERVGAAGSSGGGPSPAAGSKRGKQERLKDRDPW